LAVSDLAPSAQQLAYLVNGLLDLARRGRRHHEILFDVRIDLTDRLVRDVDRLIFIPLVLRRREEKLAFFEHPYHTIVAAVDRDLAVERVEIREKRIGDVDADDAHVGPRRVLAVVKETSLRHFRRAHSEESRHYALH